jgi:hypothetical protein
MFGDIIFRRFDKSSKIDGFFYHQNDELREIEHDLNSITMDRVGFNFYYNVRNYTAETVYISGNLRTPPTQIRSLLREGVRPDYSYTNQVVITLYNKVNSNSPDPKKKTLQVRKTEIRIPGRILGQGAVFIGELDCYLMAEAQIDATRELIAKDVTQQNWESINLPASMIKQDPAQLYEGYRSLIKQCVERRDKISIRVGVDLNYGFIPDIIKTMRVAVLDSYFVPFDDYKLVYDPDLQIDEFVIENLFVTSQQEFRSTFSELNRHGSMYLDRNEEETLFGKFYGMAIFSDKDHYLDYVHQRKSMERFNEEMLHVAGRSGDPLLREKIVLLEDQITSFKVNDEENNQLITTLKATVKQLRSDVRDREDTITKIREHYDGKMSASYILNDMDNTRRRTEHEAKKLDNEELDLHHKQETFKLNYKTAKLKTVAEILKSGWGITTASIGAIVSIIALCKKYNIKLSMGG